MQGSSISKVSNVNIDRVVGSTLGPISSSDAFKAATEVSPTVSAAVGVGGGSADNAQSVGGEPASAMNKGVLDNDFPTVSTAPLPFAPRLPYLANAQNLNFANVLSMMPRADEKIDPVNFGTSIDEMSNEFLLRTFTIEDTFEWSANDITGEVLYSAPICPNARLMTAVDGTVVDMCLFDYVCAKHKFYRGGIELKFDVIASKIHTGTLAFCTHYGVSQPPAALTTAMSQYVLRLELSEGLNSFHVIIPYRSPLEWLHMPNGPVANPMTRIQGCWSLRVINRLRLMESVASEVEINVSKRGGEDFEVSKLGSTNASLSPYFFQSGSEEMDLNVTDEDGVVALGSVKIKPPTATDGTSVSIKDELKRYFSVPIPNPKLLDPRLMFTAEIPEWYSSIYQAYAGPTRWFFKSGDANTEFTGTVVFSPDTLTSLVQSTGNPPFEEISGTYSTVETPFISQYRFAPIRDGLAGGDLYNNGTLVVASAADLDMRVAFGDTTRMGIPIAVPAVQINTAGVDNYTTEVTYQLAATIRFYAGPDGIARTADIMNILSSDPVVEVITANSALGQLVNPNTTAVWYAEYPTSDFSDAQVQSFGIAIPDGATMIYQHGVQFAVKLVNSNFVIGANAFPVHWTTDLIYGDLISTVWSVR